MYWLVHKIINNILHRRCSQCNLWLPETIEYYYLHNKSKPEKGYQGECKKCSIERSRKRNQEKREELLPYWSNYYFENKDHKRANNQRWVEEHKEERSEYQAEYRQTESFKASSRKCRINRKLHKKHDITDSEWINCKTYFNNCCCYCGKHIEKNFVKRKGILKLFDFCKDHADNYGANDITNCLPSCEDCNSKKKTMEMFKFIEIRKITYDKVDKIIQWLQEDCFKYKESRVS